MKTPRSERIHIGIIGKRNAGKSSLLNTLTGQYSSIVSDVAGTTTDPVHKPMELNKIGPVVFIDTAGYDDIGELGELRNKKTDKAIIKCDCLIYLLTDEDKVRHFDVPVIYVVSKADTEEGKERREKYKNLDPLLFVAGDQISKDSLINKLNELLGTKEERTITSNLTKAKDTVILVMPQDIQAPKGRLILPQVQTVRELLDKNSVVVCVTMENYKEALKVLAKNPDLIITDSQCFKYVYENKPDGVPLTSFSILFSAYKGDIEYFMESVKTLERLDENSKILIAEACTHPPLSEDIGRVKIPNMLKSRYGNIKIDFTRGDDFENIENYDLIIQCGSCMFNRKHVMSRVKKAKISEIPMTNYGIVIAYLQGIMDKIVYPTG